MFVAKLLLNLHYSQLQQMSKMSFGNGFNHEFLKVKFLLYLCFRICYIYKNDFMGWSKMELLRKIDILNKCFLQIHCFLYSQFVVFIVFVIKFFLLIQEACWKLVILSTALLFLKLKVIFIWFIFSQQFLVYFYLFEHFLILIQMI